ncbi:pyruvate dehydrogenase complex dihydrolipoamide acetyltransferase [Rickettsiales bacterium]|nr:pyruvate dehydrogenase complex dihydrolipoamide acetyltransferase [Rickettsiales bacterium]
MPVEVTMPALSPTMTEGTLARWVKNEGDAVEPGQVIAEIETDKATMEVEATEEGVIGKILVANGTQGVPVNDVIALLLLDGEKKADLDKYKPAKKPTKTEAEEPKKEEKAATQKQTQPSATKTLAPKSVPTPSIISTPSPGGDRVIATPLAKRIANDSGLDLNSVIGTGPHGRITKSDVENSIKTGGNGNVLRRNPNEFSAVENNTMRKVIANRLLESKQQVPHFYLNIDCQIDKLLETRKDLNDAAPTNDGKPLYKVSVNDMVIKAVAMALKKVPEANASWTDDAILMYNNVDISVAVAIDGGLITPIIRNADQKKVPTISSEMKDLAARAKSGSLLPEEFQGGGFSISNLGMYGVKNFNAIINPPQGCILAVGSGEKRAVVNGDDINIATIMTVTLSCDHRVVDGAVGAQFLAAFKSYIEKPVTMFI